MTGKVFLLGLIVLGLVSSGGAERDAKPLQGLEPGAVYEKLNRARWNLDVMTIMACTSERIAIHADDVHTELMRIRGTLPESLDLRHQRIEGRVATLYYVGRRENRDEEHIVVSRGQVTMVLEQGVWRLRHESWEDIGTEPIVREHGEIPRW